MGSYPKDKLFGSIWGGRWRSDMRLMVAFHAGAAAAFILMVVVSLPLNYLKSSDGSVFHSGSSSRLMAHAGMMMNGKDWRLPDIREAQAEDMAAEVAYGGVPRRLVPMGMGNFLFVLFSAYRTGPKSFAVVGLGPRLMHTFWSKPGFKCRWKPNGGSSSLLRSSKAGPIEGTATNYYPQELDIPTLAEYITVVVICTFDSPVDSKGGELVMTADLGQGRKHTILGFQSVEFVALAEKPGEFDKSVFKAPFRYEYLYCGGPLFGSVNPHRLREWLAYHMRLFGEKSHFIVYDNGGINDDSWRVLMPWVKLGRLTIMNVREEARYDTYYHSQFLLTNDCLFRAKSLAKWTFFFDVDEYLHVTDSPHLEVSFHNLMSELGKRGRRATSVQIQQRVVAQDHCVRNDSAPNAHKSQWAIEKLVYRRQVEHSELFPHTGRWSPLDNYKSGIQAAYVRLMGIHEPTDVELADGLTRVDSCTRMDMYFEGCEYCFPDKLHYYHYHGTTSLNEELCKEFVDPGLADSPIRFVSTLGHYDNSKANAVHHWDNSMSSLAGIVKKYELKTIGPL